MSERRGTTIDWSALRPGRAAPLGESLRERKKRLTRQLLSDTATELFLERGFDAVRVSEIAAACGVSEKTAFNYFPTKEALLLDRWENTSSALRERLADPRTPPVAAAVELLAEELGALIGWLESQVDFEHAVTQFLRFGRLLHSTPSLRAHQHQMTERLTAEAVAALAERVGAASNDPEPLITASTLIALWQVQARSVSTHLDTARTPGQLRDAVTGDVLRAARLIEAGLATWPATPGADGDDNGERERESA